MRLAIVLLSVLPTGLWAAGSVTTTPPPPPDCAEGQVRDEDTGTCMDAKDSRLNDAERMRAVRALAYAGRFGHASEVLDALRDQTADLALTYRGFIARREGDHAGARIWYEQALAQNPANHLARSYMAQGWLSEGKDQAARDALSEIRKRGGRGTWAELSLRLALDSGKTTRY